MTRTTFGALALLSVSVVLAACEAAPQPAGSAQGDPPARHVAAAPNGEHGVEATRGVVDFAAEAAVASTATAASVPRAVHAPMKRALYPSMPDKAAPLPLGPMSVENDPYAEPPLVASFQGVPDDNVWIPPDTDGAVGPSHVISLANEEIHIQDKSGTLISKIDNNTFWKASGYADLFDCHVFWEQLDSVWLMVCSAFQPKPGFALAVSQTADPTGKWNIYGIDPKNPLNTFPDYPTIGFNHKWIVVNFNVFGLGGGAPCGWCGDEVFAFDKAKMIAGTGAPHTKWNEQNSPLTYYNFTLTAAVTFDPNLDDEYLLEDWDGTQGQLNLWTITGAVGSESLVAPVTVQGSALWDDFVNDSNFGQQLGTKAMIDTGDDRIYEVTYRAGHLYAAHVIYLPSTGDSGKATRSSVQWWEIDPHGNVLQFGRIDDPSGATFYCYPSITANAYEDLLLGYTRTSAAQYPSADYAFRTVLDPPNALRADTVMKDGEGPYDKTFGSGRNRWGDYSNTVVDPVDDISMWTNQEYAAKPTNNTSHWATWWGKVGVDCASKPDGIACDDGNPCTSSDACLNHACTGTIKACPAGGACTVGACDASTGNCTVQPAPTGSACDDGNACTVGDACIAGKCVSGKPMTCADVDTCNSGMCDPASGKCMAMPKADGTACDDRSACTRSDKCIGGKCGGTAASCAPPGECQTGGTCDAYTGTCVYDPKPDGTQCSTGVCTGGNCGPSTGTTGSAPTSDNGGTTVDGGGCACSATPGSGSSLGLVAAGALAGAFAIRRRRR